MSNKNVFKSATKGKEAPPADTTNRAGGRAYKLDDKAALAQYAATGTFNDTFYSTGELQLKETLALLDKVDPTFIAKTALYSRESGRMKDMPALLVAHLSSRGEEGRMLAKQIFPLVIDNGRMVRNWFQTIRSGVTGRKSLGTAPKKLGRMWFDGKPCEAIFKNSIGDKPSLGDLVKMVRPTDLGSPERKAFYAYLMGSDNFDFDSLPPLVKEYEVFKKAKLAKEKVSTLPRVPFEMLVGMDLTEDEWKLLAMQASWTQIRMNLNTFARHGVFKDEELAKVLAAKLRDPEQIKRAKPFPYQLLMTYLATDAGTVTRHIHNALHDAVEVAVQSVPSVEGPVYVAVDVSGSMSGPVTGYRAGATTKMRCVDAAALIGATFLRKNEGSEILPFSDDLFLRHGCEPRDSIMTNANRLAKLGGGGTNMASAINYLNQHKKKGNLVVIVSDMETWMDGRGSYGYYGAGTSVAQGWAEYKVRNPQAKLVGINLVASGHCQVKNGGDVLNIGGFSDSMWEVIKSFVEGSPEANHWVKVIEAIQLPASA